MNVIREFKATKDSHNAVGHQKDREEENRREQATTFFFGNIKENI